jgi:hypothetical protein
MPSNFSIDEVDVDGTLRNAAEDAGALVSDRRSLIRNGAIAGGGLMATGALWSTFLTPAEAAISKTHKSKANDVKILQYALTLEYLESAFYASANGQIKFANPQLAYFATVAAGHEAAHVVQLKKVLGKKSIKSPTFNFGAATTDEATFAATAEVLEDTGVSAYAGQGPNILQKPVIVAALSIHSVEARHAAWIRFINGGGLPAADGSLKAAPAPAIFDLAKSEKSVLAAVTATKFITG